MPFLLLAGLLAAVPASAASHRVHPELAERAKEIKTAVILPPRIDVFQLSAGGMKEKIDEWSAEATKNVLAAIEETLKDSSGLAFRLVSEESLPMEAKSNLEETHALFDAVNTSVILHTYGPREQLFQDKIDRFDYSLGEDVLGLGNGNADVLLLVSGVDHVSTGGRIALQVAALLAGAAARTVLIPQGGATALAAALVDARSGAILWYNFVRSSGGHDLRDAASAGKLVKELLENFPIGKQEER